MALEPGLRATRLLVQANIGITDEAGTISSAMIIIIITKTMFMVLSSWQSHCKNPPGSFDECRIAPSGRRPKIKPDDRL